MQTDEVHLLVMKAKKLFFLLLLFVGLAAHSAKVKAVEDTSMSKLWSTAMASVPGELQWPTALLQLRGQLPAFLLKRDLLNPVCLIQLVVQSLMQNRVRDRLPWPPGKRPELMFDAARIFNQEVWVGTRHREFLKMKERQGAMQVETTLSIVTCVRSSSEADMFATVEAFGIGVNWLTAEGIPCGAVRMPTWLFTKSPLKDKKRRQRQEQRSSVNTTAQNRAGIQLSSYWYSPLQGVKELSNVLGWVADQIRGKKNYGKERRGDYEGMALLEMPNEELVDAGINRIGFHWQEPSHFVDYFQSMDVEACLDDCGQPDCEDRHRLGNSSLNYHFGYMPWLDQWTFNSSNWQLACADNQQYPASLLCLEQEQEGWLHDQPDLTELLNDLKRANKDDVQQISRRRALLDSCPTKLVLFPGNMSKIAFDAGDQLGDKYLKRQMETVRDLQWKVYNRIPKHDIKKTSSSAVYLTLAIGVQGLFLIFAIDIAIKVAIKVACLFSGELTCCGGGCLNWSSPIWILTILLVATAPAALLLKEEWQKTRSVRVDGDIAIDTTRHMNREGDAFLMNIYVVSVEVKDLTSRFVECSVISAGIFLVGFVLLIVRVTKSCSLMKDVRQAAHVGKKLGN